MEAPKNTLQAVSAAQCPFTVEAPSRWPVALWEALLIKFLEAQSCQEQCYSNTATLRPIKGSHKATQPNETTNTTKEHQGIQLKDAAWPHPLNESSNTTIHA